jgi:hypothetical protein
MLTDNDHLKNQVQQFTTMVDGAFMLPGKNRTTKGFDESSLLESIMDEVENARMLEQLDYTRNNRPKYSLLSTVLNTNDAGSVSSLNNLSCSERDILAAKLTKTREINDKNAAETSDYIKVLEDYINRKPSRLDPFASNSPYDAINSQLLKEKIASLSTEIEKLNLKHKQEQQELHNGFSKLQNVTKDVVETQRLNLENLQLKSENLRLLERIVDFPKRGMSDKDAKPLKSCLKPIKRGKGNDLALGDYYHKTENERKLSMMKYNNNWNQILEENALQNVNSKERKKHRRTVPKFKVPEHKFDDDIRTTRPRRDRE